MVKTYVIWYGHKIAILARKVEDLWTVAAYDLTKESINGTPFCTMTMAALKFNLIREFMNKYYKFKDHHKNWEISMAMSLLVNTPPYEDLVKLDNTIPCDICGEPVHRSYVKYTRDNNELVCPCCFTSNDPLLPQNMFEYYDAYCNDNLANFINQ